MKRKFLIAALIFSVVFFISCKKTNEKLEWKAQIEGTSSTSVTEIFKQSDPLQIKSIINSNDEKKDNF